MPDYTKEEMVAVLCEGISELIEDGETVENAINRVVDEFAAGIKEGMLELFSDPETVNTSTKGGYMKH